MKRLIAVALLSLFPVLAVPGFAQSSKIPSAPAEFLEVGSPPFAVLSADALGLNSPPTDLHLLADGRILVFANPQIAIGDGVRWETYQQKPGDIPTGARQVAIDRDGAIYLGIPRGFGRIDFGEDGMWRITPVAGWPPSQADNRPVPRSVITVGDDWFWHSGSGSILSWRPGREAVVVGRGDTVDTAFEFEGARFISDRAHGRLWRLEAEARMTSVLEGNSYRSNHTLTCALPFKPHLALVGSNGHGLQLFDGENVRPFTGSALITGDVRINDLCEAHGGVFAAAVENRGIIFFDRDGRVRQVLDHGHDQRLAQVRRLLPAPGGVIWGLADDSIVRVEFPSRLSNFETLVGRGLTSVHAARCDGRLWIQGDAVAYRGEYDSDGRLTRLVADSPPGAEVFSLSCAAGLPIVGTNIGAFYRSATGWVNFSADVVNFRLLSAAPVNGRWIYGGRNEVGWLRITPGGIVTDRFPTPGLENVFNCVTDRAGDIWVERGTSRAMRVRVRGDQLQVDMFDRQHGLPDGWTQIYELDGVVGFNVADQMMRFDAATQRFVPDDGFAQRFAGYHNIVGRPGRDGLGRIWIVANGSTHILTETPAGVQAAPERIPPGVVPLYFTFEAAGSVWIEGERRLSRYDPSARLPAPVPFRAMITHVTLPGSNRTLFSLEHGIGPLEFRDNSLIAHFLAPGNPFAAPVSFEVKLDGSDARWSSVGSAGSAVFNRLKEGSYVLHVRSVSAGVAGAETTLPFTIRPPWFRSRYAYFAYVLGVAGVIFAAFRVSQFLQRREQRRLEELVARRTRELNTSNDQLATKVEENRILSQAVEQSPVAVLITRPHGAIVFANARACHLSEFEAHELIGRKIEHLYAQPLAPELEAQIRHTLDQHHSWHGQLSDRSKSGRIVPIRVTISALRTPEGEIGYLLILKEDISDWLNEQERRQRLEAQLFQSQKLESLGTLAGGIAHDFNNILTAILGYCELAQLDAGQPQAVANDLAQIRSAGLRAKDVVAQILTFSRQSNAQLAPLDLAAPVAEALKLVRASTPSSIDFSSSLEPGIVMADFTQIQQVVLNLCTNAVHAIPDRTGVVEVALHPVTVSPELALELSPLSPGPCMCLSVRDHGTGMDRATLDRVFDPFFTTKRPGEGTGLGLPIVRGIVGSHHGAIRVRSEPGAGSTFELFFPRVHATALAEAPLAPAAPKGNGERILVVDDEPTVAQYVSARLGQLNYAPTVCGDGLEALSLLGSAPSSADFEAIVTDLTMPHLTGADLVQRLRTEGNLVPAVVITGYGSESVRAALDSLAHCKVLQKPFSGEELARVLHELIRDARAST